MDEASNNFVFKAAVYNSTAAVAFSLKFEGVSAGASAQLTVLTAPAARSYNAPGLPEVVKQTVSTIQAAQDGAFQFTLPGLSVGLLTTKA